MHLVVGTISDAYGVQGLEGKKVGTNADGNAKWAPGVFGYMIEGDGIQNGSPKAYADLPKITEGAAENVLMWAAFAPQTAMPSWNGQHNWMNWKVSKTVQELDAASLPPNWQAQVAGSPTDWGLGVECVNGTYPCEWGTQDPEIFADKNVLVPNNNSIGAQLVFITSEQIGHDTKSEDYQMKVLYEYGNCQYNFSRSAAPTRVLPNVVPVGPSPGIPAPL